MSPICLADYEAFAAARLPVAAAAYLSGGAGDGLSVAANRAAFDRLALLPRVLADFRAASTAIMLLGQRYAAPLLVAPMGFQRLFHAAGESGLAQAAAAMGAGFVLSGQASQPLEQVMAAGEGAPQLFQLYWQGSRETMLALVRRAEAAGFHAFMLTVDAPVNGVRNAEMRAGFRLPPAIRAVNLPEPVIQPAGPDALLGGALLGAPRWEDVAWLRAQTRLPFLLKGVLHPDDAQKAMAMGCTGLVVSNHGGRTLDTAVAPLAMLPAIRAACGPDAVMLVDGGIRRGTDLVKALALGANAVMVGRPIAAALAVNGPQGAAHALRLLIDEFAVAMALCGFARPGDIGRDCLAEPARELGTAGPAGFSA